jgi:hypothetical protein
MQVAVQRGKVALLAECAPTIKNARRYQRFSYIPIWRVSQGSLGLIRIKTYLPNDVGMISSGFKVGWKGLNTTIRSNHLY